MPPAARVGDDHTCPLTTGIVPHKGGPILPPGFLKLLIQGQPAATLGGPCVCVGPPDTIVSGSRKVVLGVLLAARMGDLTAHGGVITSGCLKVQWA